MQSRETDNYTTLFWKNFECEICKFGYPYLFRVNQKLYKLVDVKKPRTGNYMVMESLPLEKNTSRTIHVLIFTPEHEKFTMGRGHESLIRVNDISVSRLHAILKQTNQGIFIQDNQSKFGTLVLVKENELKLETEQNYIFQVGRSVLSIHITQVEDKKEVDTESEEQSETQFVQAAIMFKQVQKEPDVKDLCMKEE